MYPFPFHMPCIPFAGDNPFYKFLSKNILSLLPVSGQVKSKWNSNEWGSPCTRFLICFFNLTYDVIKLIIFLKNFDNSLKVA